MIKLLLGGAILALAWWVVYRLVTDQEKVRRVLRQISGNILEIGLYKDYPRPMGAALKSLNRSNAKLAGLLLPPSLLFMVPLGLVGYYLWSCAAFRPLAVGEAVLIRSGSTRPVELKLPDSVLLEAGPVSTEDSTYWKVKATREGRFVVGVEQARATLLVAEGWPSTQSLFRPGDLQVLYPPRHLWWGSYKLHWLWFVLATFLPTLIVVTKISPPGKTVCKP